MDKTTRELSKTAKESGDEEAYKEIESVRNSAFTENGELATDEDFELNMKENGLENVVKDIDKNKDVLDKEVDSNELSEASADLKNSDSEKDSKEENMSNEEIESLQNEIAELDSKKDKDKIKEIEDKLKKAAKDNGEDESKYLMKTDTDKDGNPRQKKTGPRGGKYYRVKGKDGWGPWNSGTPNESLVTYLQNNIYETCYGHRLKYYLNSKLN